MFEVGHYHVSMLLEYCQRNEKVKVAAQVVGPESFPQPKGIRPLEVPFVPDQEHAEEKEEIRRVGGLEM